MSFSIVRPAFAASPMTSDPIFPPFFGHQSMIYTISREGAIARGAETIAAHGAETYRF